MKRLCVLLFGMAGLIISWTLSGYAEPSPEPSPSTVGLGQIEFPTSGKAEAQSWFIRGALLLHNFQYEDAKEAFLQAQRLDQDFAMAYWGEAMTENHPLWGEQSLKEGRAILSRFAATPASRLAKTPTKRERGYLQAIEALYGNADKSARDQAYADAMRSLAEAFPDDLEAQTLYALALLGSVQGKRDTAVYMKAAAIAEGVFLNNPQHPGAVHYLIHSYDDPIHAPLGLRAARIYSSLAPAASHAQHMPSHIFMALGMWKEVITANETAWASSEARITRKGLTISARPYHTLKWLMYAYLQAGQRQEAKRVLSIIKEDAQKTRSVYARGYRASMRAIYMVETEEWDTSYFNEDRTGLPLTSAASELFAIGMSAVNTQDFLTAKKALDQLKKRIDPQKIDSLSQDEVAGLSMTKELEGLILLQESHALKALTFLQEAAALEDSLPYDYGPPIPIKPTHELLGEVYFELNQPEKSKEEFAQALTRAPERRLSLKGMKQFAQEKNKD
ncbi:MAG: hypothetical protein NPIRA05_08930 [Nitrospirales bacterium]|nr:MAG: hypothetical protein NPIRA05_08930 [Nitrospirales bacterium]